MPIWLRKFIFHNIQEWYTKEAEEQNKINSKINSSSPGKNTRSIDMANPNKSDVPKSPSYSTTLAKDRKR